MYSLSVYKTVTACDALVKGDDPTHLPRRDERNESHLELKTLFHSTAVYL